MPTDVYYPCRLVPLLKDGELKVAQVEGKPKRKMCTWVWAFTELERGTKTLGNLQYAYCLINKRILKSYLKRITTAV